MNRTRFEVVPGTQRANRFLWLVAVPTGTCFANWWVVGAGARHHPISSAVVAALLPLVGLTSILTYRWLTQDVVRLEVYIPLALAAVVFGPSMIELGVAMSREPDGNFIPVLQYGLGFLLPWIAFICGLCAFTLVDRRTRA